MIDNCKICNSNDLEFIKDYEYQFEEDPIEIINIQKCNTCKCIHKIVDNEVEFYEFSARDDYLNNAASGYAMSNNDK